MPECRFIYACDRLWWKNYHAETPWQAEKWSGDKWSAENYGLAFVQVRPGNGINVRPGVVNSGKNSGYQAINLAYHLGFRRIILIGYDMQHTGGKRHWHDDHPKGMGNSDGIKSWVKCFDELPEYTEPLGIELINATIETAITGIPRRNLESCFCDTND